MYSAQLLDRFYHPRWVGELAAPTATATEGNPTCGDVVQIDIEVTDGVLSVVRFRTLGCAVAIAASDALCDLATGQTIAAAKFVHVDEVIEAVGGIPPKRESCAAAPLAALRSALFRVNPRSSIEERSINGTRSSTGERSINEAPAAGRRTASEPPAGPPAGR